MLLTVLETEMLNQIDRIRLSFLSGDSTALILVAPGAWQEITPIMLCDLIITMCGERERNF